MATKYYAIRKGKKPGIYTNWPEAQKQILGFSHAEYKSFTTKSEAEEFLHDTTTTSIPESGLQAYVDGSFSATHNRYSYGVVLLEDGEIITTLKNADDDKKYADSFQIAGECFGALNAIRWAINHKYKSITLFYDYLGIEKWAKKEWQAKKPVSQDYVAFFDKYSSYIDVQFVKVKAHTGIEMNELADQLAKEALK